MKKPTIHQGDRSPALNVAHMLRKGTFALWIFVPKATQVKATGINHLICECIVRNIRLRTQRISLVYKFE